jgi:acyl transferase domain-containing protein
MLAAAERLRDRFQGVSCGELRYPLFSTVLGRELNAVEAADPDYWCRQILLPVRFSDAVREVASGRRCGFLESGPGQTLAAMVRSILGAAAGPVVGSLPASRRGIADDRLILTSLGALWTDGHPVDWEAVYPAVEQRRTPLPTYSFDRIRYWLESRPRHGAVPEAPSAGAFVVAARRGKTRPAVSTAYAAAETERQQRLVEIFEEILGLAGIGLDDDLFELGGHSLMATILASRVRDAFGVELHLDDVFAAANVRALAVRLGDAAASEALVERLLAESLEASAL